MTTSKISWALLAVTWIVIGIPLSLLLVALAGIDKLLEYIRTVIGEIVIWRQHCRK